MRIVGGRHKGRAIKAPPGRDVRPTSDRVRESVFNILLHGIDEFDIDGVTVLDVFSGTGALGLEALSRGAAHATFIDQDRKALAVARENAAHLKEWRNTTLLNLDATRLAPPPLAAKAPCGLAFVDAPYEKGLTGPSLLGLANKGLTGPSLLGLANKGWIGTGSVIVCEVGAAEPLDVPRAYELIDERTYGAARITFLRISA